MTTLSCAEMIVHDQEMKCIFFTLNLLPGGAERHFLNLLNHWPTNTEDLLLILIERRGRWLENLSPLLRISTLGSSSTHILRHLYWLALLPKLLIMLRSEKPDVILTTLWFPTFLVALLRPFLLKKTHIVWSVQSDIGRELGQYRFGRVLTTFIHRLFNRPVDLFITPSRGMARRTVDEFAVRSEKVITIPNAVQMSGSPCGTGMVDDAVFRISSVGRLHPVKGFDCLLSALSILKDRRLNFSAVVLGDGPDSARLLQMRTALGLEHIVEFPGYQEPYPTVNASHLFVSSSHWETFGVAIAEAMQLGIPVVATATDGASDLVVDGQTGLLVPIEDSLALANAIEELSKHPQLRASMSKLAREIAQDWTPEKVADKYHRLIVNQFHLSST